MAIKSKVGTGLVSIYNPSKAYNGYTLFSNTGSKDVWLIDMNGRFVHHWETPQTMRTHAKLYPNGNLIANQSVPTDPLYDMPGGGSKLVELDWDGNVVWKYEDPYMNSHDWDRMKNGNTMISRWVPVPKNIAAKVKGGIPGSERDGVMWGDCFQEITPEGKVIWEWLAYEHMDFETDILCPLCARDTLTYVNSIFLLPNGDVMTSFRLINTVAIIDKKTGNIKWQWGPGEIGHQHNPTLLGNGNVILFDNGLHRLAISSALTNVAALPFSRVVEVNPKTNHIEWEYRDPELIRFWSPVEGGAQRLPNGNTLICESTKGRFFEVTPDKEIVWEFVNPFYTDYRKLIFGWINWVFRADRYSPDFEGLKGKNLDPDRFEWILQEKGKTRAAEVETPEEEKLRKRITRLGY